MEAQEFVVTVEVDEAALLRDRPNTKGFVDVVPAEFTAKVSLVGGDRREVSLVVEVSEDLEPGLASFRMLSPDGLPMAAADIRCKQAWIDEAVAQATRRWSLVGDTDDTSVLRAYRRRHKPGPTGYGDADKAWVLKTKEEGFTWKEVQRKYAQKFGVDPRTGKTPSIPTLHRWADQASAQLEQENDQ
jgi:hypothetical protein